MRKKNLPGRPSRISSPALRPGELFGGSSQRAAENRYRKPQAKHSLVTLTEDQDQRTRRSLGGRRMTRRQRTRAVAATIIQVKRSSCIRLRRRGGSVAEVADGEYARAQAGQVNVPTSWHSTDVSSVKYAFFTQRTINERKLIFYSCTLAPQFF